MLDEKVILILVSAASSRRVEKSETSKAEAGLPTPSPVVPKVGSRTLVKIPREDELRREELRLLCLRDTRLFFRL